MAVSIEAKIRNNGYHQLTLQTVSSRRRGKGFQYYPMVYLRRPCVTCGVECAVPAYSPLVADPEPMCERCSTALYYQLGGQ